MAEPMPGWLIITRTRGPATFFECCMATSSSPDRGRDVERRRLRQRRERVDDLRIEGVAGGVDDRAQRVLRRERRAVRPFAGHGVVCVGHTEDARAESDVLTGGGIGI